MLNTWSAPVKFQESDRSGCRTITDAEQALRVLLEHFTAPYGPAYYDALRACISAVEGAGDPDRARVCFIEALAEIGIFPESQISAPPSR